MSELETRFLQALPAGEWIDVEVIPDPGGMMESRSVHATVTWVREGNVEAYIKCIFGRGASAGRDTALVVGTSRLDRVRERLVAARGAVDLPLVKILEVRHLESANALLIAMKRVTPLHQRLRAGDLSPILSLNVLETLAAERCGDWIHYDICPKNTALAPDGECVFIDPESMYRVDDLRADVTYPAFKFHRTPADLAKECQNEAIKGTLSAQMARKKHDAEVLMLAAECSLGLWGGDFTTTELDSWCAGAKCADHIREFWRAGLAPLAKGDVPSPIALAQRLRGVCETGQALVVGLATADTMAAPTEMASATHQVQIDSSELDIAALDSWQDLGPVRRALRRDLLQSAQVATYRERLLALAHRRPAERCWWDELLLVALVYERDPRLAIQLADEALGAFKDDAEFTRKKQLARMWANANAE